MCKIVLSLLLSSICVALVLFIVILLPLLLLYLLYLPHHNLYLIFVITITIIINICYTSRAALVAIVNACQFLKVVMVICYIVRLSWLCLPLVPYSCVIFPSQASRLSISFPSITRESTGHDAPPHVNTCKTPRGK